VRYETVSETLVTKGWELLVVIFLGLTWSLQVLLGLIRPRRGVLERHPPQHVMGEILQWDEKPVSVGTGSRPSWTGLELSHEL